MKASRKGLAGMNIAFLFLGLVSGLFAGLLAFVITYDEYSRHEQTGEEY